MGYQACGVTGTCYIGLDGQESEWLTNIGDDDTAVFRYIESADGFSGVEIEGEGSGQVMVYLNDKKAATVSLENGMAKAELTDRMHGRYEVTLRFTDVKGLSIRSLRFI